MELADPVSVEDRGTTAAFRDPEKPKKPPVRTTTLDKVVIDRIADYYIQTDLKFEEEVRRIYSLYSFRVLATNLLLKAGAPRHIRMMRGRWTSDEGMDTYTREELGMMLEFMRLQSKQVLKAYQIIGASEGMKTAGGIQGVSRGGAGAASEGYCGARPAVREPLTSIAAPQWPSLWCGFVCGG